MFQSIRQYVGIAVLGLACVGGSAIANAAVISVGTRAGLGGNDLIEWGQLGPAAANVAISNPSNVVSNGGLGATVSKVTAGTFQRADCAASGFTTFCNFAEGDELLFNDETTPLVITFANPVQGVGTQIMNNSASGQFDAVIEAFDTFGASLGSFTRNDGVTDFGRDNSAIFIGLLSDAADIASVKFDVPSPQSGQFLGFFVNQIELLTVSTDVPEPASFALFSLGLAGLGYARRRRVAK